MGRLFSGGAGFFVAGISEGLGAAVRVNLLEELGLRREEDRNRLLKHTALRAIPLFSKGSKSATVTFSAI
jgi:hypothetical protein